MNRLLLVATTMMAWLAVPPTLSDVEFRATEVADSGSYFLYRYVVVNPATSSSGLVTVEMDISASSGTPAFLTATGEFLDGTSLGTAEPWAEVGPIVPTGWDGTAWSDARLNWALPYTAWQSFDSVAPGDSVAGFGIRSSYLPGLRAMTYRQTPESCCAEELADSTVTAVLATPFDFEVTGWSVGPRYKPEEMEISIVQDQLDTVCDDPLWIDDTTLCSTLTDSLDAVAARLGVNNYSGARMALEDVGDALTTERSPSGEVVDNAYFLLKTNIDYLLDEVIPDVGPSGVILCAGGPTSDHVGFNVVPDIGDLIVSTPHNFTTEQLGVDPLGASCHVVWYFGVADTAVANVSIAVNSAPSGWSVDEVGMIVGTDTTIVSAVDSVLTMHDGITGGTIYFEFTSGVWRD